MYRLLITAVLLACSPVTAQDTEQFILAARRSGVIELIEPASLNTLGRIHVDFPLGDVVLNEVSASANGSTIYVEGPIAGNSGGGCCSLYSIDLPTLRIEETASIAASPFPRSEQLKIMRNDRVHRSPDGHWLFGVKSFPSPALDVYDAVQGIFVRQLVPAGLEGDWHPTGTWSGDRFYLYASKGDGSAARLWIVSPDTTDLGAGVAVEPFVHPSGCNASSFASEQIAASGNALFIYEAFGFILDRRAGCPNLIPGGAWEIDPSNGRLLRQITPELHFSALVSDKVEPVLYGLSNGGQEWKDPVQLVSIDARDGKVLQLRTLDRDFWHISIAALRKAPRGDVRVIQDPKPSAP
jgi:hypothetical protein